MDADFLLLRRMRQGDEDAIEEFVRKYYPLILRYCRLHLPDTDEAEDVTQEAFARFFRTLPQYQHYGKAANYLYVIAGNLCRDSFKKIRPLPLDEVPEQPQEVTPELDRRMCGGPWTACPRSCGRRRCCTFTRSCPRAALGKSWASACPW